MARTLTVKERILLHLFEFNRFAESYEAPMDVTQTGIAQAVDIRVHHVGQYTKPLAAEGLVEERTSHVQRKPRKRKVYFLTAKGRLRAASLRNALLKEEVPFRTKTGELRTVPLLRIHQEERRGTTLLGLLGEWQSLGYIAEASEPVSPEAVDFSQEAPKVGPFYGREDELREVGRGLKDAALVVVTGMAGVGKTTLASKICEGLRGRRPLFWRRVRPWDTATDLALRLSVFLKALGKSGLHGYLAGSGPKEFSGMEDLLAADLEGTSSVLVFDDVQNASEDGEALLSIVFRALGRQKGASALFLSRTVPAFYSRRDVAVEGAVVEVSLKGLDRASSMSLLADTGIADPLLGSLVEACAGSPLFLKLVGSAGLQAAPETGWKTLESYISEEIEPSLSDAECACLEVASLYEFAVPDQGLLLEEGVRRKTLVSLQRKGLLEGVEGDRFALHDTIRSYFQEGISSERREALAAKAVPWLLAQGEGNAKAGNPHRAIEYLANAVAIEVDEPRRLASLNRLGYLRRQVGDFPGAIEAYRTALRQATEEADRARLHESMALCFEVQGQLEEATREVEDGLKLLPRHPSLEAAWLLYRKASVAYARQDYTNALGDLERVTTWMPGLPQDPELWGWLANLRGLIHLEDPSRLDPALSHADFQAAIEAFEAVGEQRGLCRAYNNFGLASLHMGQVDDALSYFGRSADIAQEIGDEPARLMALFTKAWYLMECVGDYKAAEALYQETYKLAKETHQRQKLIWHYWHLANLYRRQGRYEEARESLSYFLEASGEMLNVESRLEAVALIVRLCASCGDADAAKTQLKEVERLADRIRSAVATFHAAWSKAVLRASQGGTEEADASFRRALAVASGHHGEFLLDYGRFLASAGEAGRAREVLSQACAVLEGDSLFPLAAIARETLRANET